MHLLPVAGLGTILRGETSTEWHDVLLGNKMLTTTRLPQGRCAYPLAGGVHRVIGPGDASLEAKIDLQLVPKLGPGPYDVQARGTVCAWIYDGDPGHGLLAGGAPDAAGVGTLDIGGLDIPHGTQHIAVQVRADDRIGPIHFVSYQPVPEPASVAVDHDIGTFGPRTHLVLNAGSLPRFELTVHRHIRQTDVQSSSSFEIHDDANKLTFDDLLHGDELTLQVEPPYALADEGVAVQNLVYRYRAVPETRLERLGAGEPVAFVAGLRPTPTIEVNELLGAALGLDASKPTWRDEWPDATHDGMTSILDAVAPAQLSSPPANGAALRWWLHAINSQQDLASAKWLQSLQIQSAPNRVDQMARAVRFLDGFPAHIFKEMEAEVSVSDGIAAFQERLGMHAQPGAAVLGLAKSVYAALGVGADDWAKHIRDAKLDWLDGAVAPLAQGPTLRQLRDMMVKDPSAAIDALRTARQAIWQVARTKHDLLRQPDLRAREALLAWHLERNRGLVQQLGNHLNAAGISLPDEPIPDVPALARRLGQLLRAANAGIDRVHSVPTIGPAFVTGAAREGARFADELRLALSVWCHERVPAAIRTPAQRLMDTLTVETLEQMAVWHAFIQDRETLMREVSALAASEGENGKRAKHVAALFEEALEHGDPEPFATAISDFGRIESGLMQAREAWESAIHGCSSATREALGLLPGQGGPWETVAARIHQDAAELRVLAELLAAHAAHDDKRLAPLLREGGDLDRLLDQVDSAGPDTERARAVADYDRLRVRLGGWFGAEDTRSSLRMAYVAKVIDDVKIMLRRRIGNVTEATKSALQAFPDIDGTRELNILTRYLEMTPTIDPRSAEAVADGERIEHLMEHIRGHSADPWARVEEAIMSRLQVTFPMLAKYLGDRTPSRQLLAEPRDAIEWLHALASDGRDPVTGTDIATMLPGTRRLIHHTLQERNLWLA